MKNVRLWLRVFVRRKPPRDRKARERKVEEVRGEAFGPIDDKTRAEDRQRLADAVKGGGTLI